MRNRILLMAELLRRETRLIRFKESDGWLMSWDVTGNEFAFELACFGGRGACD